jgi:hypothetical protein
LAIGISLEGAHENAEHETSPRRLRQSKIGVKLTPIFNGHRSGLSVARRQVIPGTEARQYIPLERLAAGGHEEVIIPQMNTLGRDLLPESTVSSVGILSQTIPREGDTVLFDQLESLGITKNGRTAREIAVSGTA